MGPLLLCVCILSLGADMTCVYTAKQMTNILCLWCKTCQNLVSCISESMEKITWTFLCLKMVLDYSDALLRGFPKNQIGYLQLVQITAARIFTKAKPSAHVIAPLLKSPRWFNYLSSFSDHLTASLQSSSTTSAHMFLTFHFGVLSLNVTQSRTKI